MTVNALAVHEDDDAPDDGPPDQITLVRMVSDREQEFADFMADAAPGLARTAWLLCAGTAARAGAGSRARAGQPTKRQNGWPDGSA